MRKKVLLGSYFLVAAAFAGAQVQIDKPIQLTGATGERAVTALELPVNGTDAANKDYVDAAVAASGGSIKPEAISAKSGSQLTFKNAVQYCETLTEGGNTDWRLPNFEEIVYFVGSSADTDMLWTKEKSTYDIATNQNFMSARLSDGKWSTGGVISRFLPSAPSWTSGGLATNASSGGWITVMTITPTIGNAFLLPNFQFENYCPSSTGGFTTLQTRYTLNFADGTSLTVGPYSLTTSWTTRYAFAARDMEEAWMFGPVSNIVVEANYVRNSNTSYTYSVQARVTLESAYELILSQKDGNGLYTRCVR